MLDFGVNISVVQQPRKGTVSGFYVYASPSPFAHPLSLSHLKALKKATATTETTMAVYRQQWQGRQHGEE
jgi:hypothetical protein